MRVILKLFLGLFSIVSFGQINNGYVDNALPNFKLNFFTDEIELYSYYFFIDYLENNPDEFYVFDEKFSGDIKQMRTKVFNEEEEKENFLGSRFEVFNNKNQKEYVKDLDKPSKSESSIKEYFYSYNDDDNLKNLKIVNTYDSNKIQELESVYYNFTYFQDSIIVTQKEDFFKKVSYDSDFNDDSKGEFNKFQKLYIKDNKIVKTEVFDGSNYPDSHINIIYNDNGYELKDVNSFGSSNFLMIYNKDKNEVALKNIEPSKKLNFVTFYKFDSNNNIIRISEDLYRVKGKYIEKPVHSLKQTIKYKYDKYNNWVYREVKNETKNTTKLFFRTIEYR